MGSNNGTGQPMYLRCAKCKTRRGRFYGQPERLEATGRTRPRRDGRGGARITHRFIEYRCLVCGHVGWSKHMDAERLLARLTP